MYMYLTILTDYMYMIVHLMLQVSIAANETIGGGVASGGDENRGGGGGGGGGGGFFVMEQGQGDFVPQCAAETITSSMKVRAHWSCALMHYTTCCQIENHYQVKSGCFPQHGLKFVHYFYHSTPYFSELV